jgi:CRP/FNR family transcriptional regulator
MTHDLPLLTRQTTACHACPLREMGVFKNRNDAEVSFIQKFKAGEQFATAGTTIVEEKTHNPKLYTVLSGWVFRYRTLDDERRQIINFGLPGDFLGLQATLDDPMSHGIEALTEVTLCQFEREKLWELYADHPLLAFDMTWLAAQQERSFEEHLLTLGQRTAFERVAYLLWTLYDRARAVGLVMDDSVRLPIRQHHLADTLGLSLVHTNKTLQKIRRDGAIEIADQYLHVNDEQRLITLGRVDTSVSARRPLL